MLKVIVNRLKIFLDSLITFDIPEPNVTHDDSDSVTDANLSLRDDVKRFRNEYSKPVQFR